MLPARCYICIFYSNSVWRNVISNNCCVVAWLKTRQLSVMTGLIRFRFLFSTCLLFIYVNSCASSAAASSSSIRFSSCVLEAVSSQRLSGASWKPNSLQNVTQRYFFSVWLTSLGTGTRTHALYMQNWRNSFGSVFLSRLLLRFLYRALRWNCSHSFVFLQCEFLFCLLFVFFMLERETRRENGKGA